jgi:HlyD family secretion protein
MIPRCGLIASSMALVMVGIAGCGEKKAAPPEDTKALARVTVVRPERKTIRRSIVQPGQIEAFDLAKLYAKVPAYVERSLVDIGDKVVGPRVDDAGVVVERGQVLAELSAPEIEQELEQKKALVVQASADVDRAQAAVKVARADLDSARSMMNETAASVGRMDAEYARWNSEYDRVVQLVSRSAVTQKLADETKAQLNAAAAARAEAQAKVESARSKIAANGALLEQSIAEEAASRARFHVAETDEARAAALVQYLTIEAPFDGIVAQRNADIGFFAEAGGGRQAEPLFVVVRGDRVRVYVDLPEMDAPLVDQGDRAVVRTQSLPGREFVGAVTRSAWSLDAATRTLHTEVDIPNPDEKLRPGMYALVTIDLAVHEDAMLVPLAAVVEQDGGVWCYVVVEGKAVRKAVTPGLKNATEIEIVSGLNGDESVISAKAASLKDGQALEIVETTASR